jgi:putative ABC transport system permease protein
MVIKSMIVRQKKELGIYKALGYTDRQLMKMIAVSFMPSVAAGTLAGSLGAGLSVNRLASSLFGMLGISKMELNVNILLLILMGIVLAVFAYGISMAVAGKLKSITVYGLLAED